MNIIEFKKKKDGNHNRIAPPISTSNLNNQIAVGIDLGTTHSVVCAFQPENPHPVILEYEGNQLVPSLVAWDSKDETFVAGEQARLLTAAEPWEVIKSTKKFMGDPQELFTSYGKQISPEDAAFYILQYLVAHPTIQKEKDEGREIHAVVTVPAHFDDGARSATLHAAQKAGIQVLRIINEPTAAALAYSFLDSAREKHHDNIVVFDFGGGTFDITVLEKNGQNYQVLSTLGNHSLGGDDIDQRVAQYFLQHVKFSEDSQGEHKNRVLRKLLYHAENAKKKLQEQGSVSIVDNALDACGSQIHLDFSRHEFENLSYEVIAKTIHLTTQAMKQARLSPQKISKILLVGGSTRLKQIRSELESHFPCEIDCSLQPDLSVSIGASLQAALIQGIHFDTILVDVCSHSLGIGIVESEEEIYEIHKKIAHKMNIPYPISDSQLSRLLGPRFEQFRSLVLQELCVQHILPKNSPLPATKSEFFTTVHDNQAGVQVVVVQGEENLVKNNKMIGTFFFAMNQPCPKGSQCEIQLTYDTNGMVHVSAKQLNSDNESHAIFDSRSGEVLGWSPKNSQDMEAPEEFDDTPEITSLSHFFDKKKAGKVKPLVKAKSSTAITNAMVLKVKRAMKKIDPQTTISAALQSNLDIYLKLLEQAHSGENVDEDLDSMEEKLEKQIEEATHP